MTDTDRRRVNRAVALLRHVVCEGGPDMATSRADARIALCVSKGIPLEDIDPSLGYNRSEESYRMIRTQHVERLAGDPDNPWFARDMRNAYRAWSRMRPDLATGDDWFAASGAVDRYELI
jgi:hypothetical protein